MTKRLPLLLLGGIACWALSSCKTPQQAFYASPVNGYSNQYNPLPQLIDSSHTAFYAGATFYSGSANSGGKDYQNTFIGSFTVAHHTDKFQAWYGGDLFLGSYHMGRWDTSKYNTTPSQSTVAFDQDILNSYSSAHSFGSVGFHGGADYVMPITKGEWRVIGIEGSLNHDFGSYYNIRKNLPDSAASIIARGPNYGTLGISSELIGSTAHGEFGFRMATGWALGAPYRNSGVYDYKREKYVAYGYFSMTTHFTHDRFTLFGQLQFATKADGISFGMAYRLNKPRTAPPSLPHRRKALLGN
ncbi:MAG TPA: hypothetical protein VHD83_00360 [Puia sp.]|nr:hypothetical protein [Puia sp.]